uniref:ABAS1 delta n=1 Tax=Glycine max TaxID=3847 RepID=A0A3S9GW27_SOYBN|nr:ABAS1 delta [Glycine max]
MAMVGLERRLESLILLPSQGRAGPRKNTTSFSKLFNYLTEIGRKLKILLVQKQLFRSEVMPRSTS